MLNESLLAQNRPALQTVVRLTVPSKKVDLIVLNGAYSRTNIHAQIGLPCICRRARASKQVLHASTRSPHT